MIFLQQQNLNFRSRPFFFDLPNHEVQNFDMSELFGVSAVDRREEVARQYRNAQSNVANTKPSQGHDLTTDGEAGNKNGGKGRKRHAASENDSDGLSEPEPHGFDVIV